MMGWERIKKEEGGCTPASKPSNEGDGEKH